MKSDQTDAGVKATEKPADTEQVECGNDEEEGGGGGEPVCHMIFISYCCTAAVIVPKLTVCTHIQHADVQRSDFFLFRTGG